MKNRIFNNESIKNVWNNWSENYYAKEYKDTDTIELIKKTPLKVFPAKVRGRMQQYYKSFEGMKICIPSSGDNLAAFAFHLLGAEVTSCDISCNQIDNAKSIAEKNGWNINFKVLDSMDMSSINSESYDLLYTSNGVHVWISDLCLMYAGFNRILKNGGRYIFFETHPFIRPFDDTTNELKVNKSYNKIEMFSGDMPNYHWRVQDFTNSIIESGFTINAMDELFAERDTIGARWWNISEWDEKADVNKNPYAALPQWISYCVEKLA